MAKEIPKMHRELGFDFWWDRRKLWAIDLPIVEMPVKDLAWHLTHPFWSEAGEPLAVSPLDVAESPDEHQEQFQRTMSADLAYPINVIYLKGRWLIMDGYHRLLKAHILGQESILAKQAQEWHKPLIVKDLA